MSGNDIDMGNCDHDCDAFCLAAAGKVGMFKFAARCKSEGGRTFGADLGRLYHKFYLFVRKWLSSDILLTEKAGNRYSHSNILTHLKSAGAFGLPRRILL